MSQHTPLPLEFRSRFYLGFPGDPFSVASVNSCHTVPASAADVAEANARRLAACWNACQGIDTETLETGPEFLPEVHEVLNWHKERAELLAVLQRLVNLSGHPLFAPQVDLPAWKENIAAARDLVARMRGEPERPEEPLPHDPDEDCLR